MSCLHSLPSLLQAIKCALDQGRVVEREIVEQFEYKVSSALKCGNTDEAARLHAATPVVVHEQLIADLKIARWLDDQRRLDTRIMQLHAYAPERAEVLARRVGARRRRLLERLRPAVARLRSTVRRSQASKTQPSSPMIVSRLAPRRRRRARRAASARAPAADDGGDGPAHDHDPAVRP